MQTVFSRIDGGGNPSFAVKDLSVEPSTDSQLASLREVGLLRADQLRNLDALEAVLGPSVVSLRGRALIAALSPLASSSGEWRVRCAALDALGRLALIDDTIALQAVASRVRDSNTSAREAAFHALGHLCGRGHKGAEEELVRNLLTKVNAVRWAALENLKRLSGRGSQATIVAVAARISDHNLDVRKNSVEALPLVAGRWCPSSGGGRGALP